MEAAMRMRVFAAVVMMLVAVFAVQNVAAQESPAPAPGPTAGAVTFGPAAAFASVLALAFGFLF